MISSILSRLSVFNNGSVWALYLLHVIIRTALYCSLNILSNLKPHDNMQYCRWGRIKLLYKIFNIFWGKNRFNLHIIPSDLDILFDIFCTCPFHVKSWSIVKPKKSKSVTRSIICSFKFSCGIRFSNVSLFMVKNHKFCFLNIKRHKLILWPQQNKAQQNRVNNPYDLLMSLHTIIVLCVEVGILVVSL